ncbi:MAG: hypothetical protein K6G28_00110 [Acholeplasmatales bacterium]|nr:hypothetical protein [Acholeplasmatales bacterium]
MNKSCFLCPIYDSGNHFEFGYNLVKSMKNLGVKTDIFFIFSNIEQQEKFYNLVSDLNYRINHLILPEEFLDYKSKVVVKKLYGLKELMNKYNYIALIDCETIFIKNGDFDEIFKTINDNRLCLNANISYDGFFILRACFLQLGLYKNKKLRKEFSNFKYNYWFNEIQVYDCSVLPEFFEWLEQFDKEKYLNDWYCFEYYIYGAFLILEKDYHIIKHKNLKSMGGILEYLPMYSTQKQHKILNQLKTHWTSSADVQNDNCYLRFHLDRLNQGGYGYKKNPLKLKLRRLAFLILHK